MPSWFVVRIVAITALFLLSEENRHERDSGFSYDGIKP